MVRDNTFYVKNQVRSAQLADEAVERQRRGREAASGRGSKDSKDSYGEMFKDSSGMRRGGSGSGGSFTGAYNTAMKVGMSWYTSRLSLWII